MMWPIHGIEGFTRRGSLDAWLGVINQSSAMAMTSPPAKSMGRFEET